MSWKKWHWGKKDLLDRRNGDQRLFRGGSLECSVAWPVFAVQSLKKCWKGRPGSQQEFSLHSMS